MKQHASRFLKGISIFLLAFPISYLILSAIWFDVPGSECVRIILTPSFYIVSFWAILAGYGLWEMQRWGWYAFQVALLFILYENVNIVLNYAHTSHPAIAFALSILLLIGVLFRVQKEIRVPYFFPQIRWWESNPRYKISVPVKLLRPDQKPLVGEIMDISAGGCFVKVRDEFIQDENILLRFSVFGHELNCKGVTVWRTNSSVTHPKGIGVKFQSLGKHERHCLRLATQRLNKISALYRRSRYFTNQDELLKKIEELNAPTSRHAQS